MTITLLDQKEKFERYARQNSWDLLSNSFVSVAAWKDFFEFEFKEIDQCLCVFAHSPIGCFLYMPPLGQKVSSDILDQCFDYMESLNGSGGITRIDNVSYQQLSLFSDQKYDVSKKGYEYCYFKNDIIQLKGNTYKSKRAAYNTFVKNNKYIFREYVDEDFDQCMELYNRWADERKTKYNCDIYQNMLDENINVHGWSLKNYKNLDLIGRVITIDGLVRAYSFGYVLNPKVFCILYEVADLNFTGLPVCIFREFCRDKALETYSFINVMDDSGLENIKKTKMSFHPRVLVPSYTVKKK